MNSIFCGTVVSTSLIISLPCFYCSAFCRSEPVCRIVLYLSKMNFLCNVVHTYTKIKLHDLERHTLLLIKFQIDNGAKNCLVSIKSQGPQDCLNPATKIRIGFFFPFFLQKKFTHRILKRFICDFLCLLLYLKC